MKNIATLKTRKLPKLNSNSLSIVARHESLSTSLVKFQYQCQYQIKIKEVKENTFVDRWSNFMLIANTLILNLNFC